jgi:transcriptional regulator with PAS, ATPase and Fis domain
MLVRNPAPGEATLGTFDNDAPVDPDAVFLRIVRNSIATLQRLPSAGSFVIGRAEGVDILIEDRSVSRRHARLELGPRLRIEDLGSANGTRLRSRAIAKQVATEFEPGDVIELGAVVIVVQRGRADAPRPVDPIIVRGGAMAELEVQVARVASGMIPVLIRGEAGVGKEVMADRIHGMSPRAKGPLVRINCATLSETLLTSELFGYEKGALPGADQPKAGLLETAHRGTAFLDEIGELSSALQAKLLRVLEHHVVQRIGASTPRPIDVRFVAATSRDLEADIEAGRFRRDLFSRLSGFQVMIPPLRQRVAEIDSLSNAFLAAASVRASRAAPPSLSPSARGALLAHSWPGNVRELRNVIERAVLVCSGATISVDHLPIELTAKITAPATPASMHPKTIHHLAALREELDAAERERITDALEACGGHPTRAATLLGISHDTLLARLGALGMPAPKKAT